MVVDQILHPLAAVIKSVFHYGIPNSQIAEIIFLGFFKNLFSHDIVSLCLLHHASLNQSIYVLRNLILRYSDILTFQVVTYVFGTNKAADIIGQIYYEHSEERDALHPVPFYHIPIKHCSIGVAKISNRGFWCFEIGINQKGKSSKSFIKCQRTIVII